MRVGDEISGMKIISVTVNNIDEQHYTARVAFSGEATLSGTYAHDKKDEEMVECRIRFEVDGESATRLPREMSDTRIPWFVFTNHEEAEKLLGPPGTSGRATVVIDKYGINHAYSCEWNTARLVKVVEKQLTPRGG